MLQAEFEGHVGPQNICANITDAILRAQVIFASGQKVLTSA
jgi:hypothetical protein